MVIDVIMVIVNYALKVVSSIRNRAFVAGTKTVEHEMMYTYSEI